jgi:hypothetical protein
MRSPFQFQDSSMQSTSGVSRRVALPIPNLERVRDFSREFVGLEFVGLEFVGLEFVGLEFVVEGLADDSGYAGDGYKLIHGFLLMKPGIGWWLQRMLF